MPGRKYNIGDYRYGFNGKEADRKKEWASLVHYDYGFRIYNPALGKWLSVDPLSRKNQSISPYAQTDNNPVLFLDPDGRDNILYIAFITNKNGKPVLQKAARDLIVKRAQELYAQNGLNVKVVGIQVNRPFSNNELDLLDETDRITYLGLDERINSSEFANGEAKAGVTFNAEDRSKYSVGYFNLSAPISYPGNYTDDEKYEKIYESEYKAIYPNGKLVFDAATWIARGVIHEGGGHGVLGPGHSSFDGPKDIMFDGRYTPTPRFPSKQYPELLFFRDEDLKTLGEYYGGSIMIKIGDDVINVCFPGNVPKDNFTNRLEEMEPHNSKN